MIVDRMDFDTFKIVYGSELRIKFYAKSNGAEVDLRGRIFEDYLEQKYVEHCEEAEKANGLL